MGKSKRKQITKKNKTTKNKTPLKNCERFCEKDYRPQLDKLWKPALKKANIKPSKRDKIANIKSCKRFFCNKECKEGFTFFGEKQRSIDFYKDIKNGFHKKYKNDQVEMLKKRGALSACNYDGDYNPFHK